MTNVKYGYQRNLGKVPFDKAIERATEALKTEGFGVLTTIDVKATMKAKLGIDRPAYTILGACNPTLAHKALTGEPEIGLLLPCNVVVAESANGSEVQIADPKEMFKIVDNRELAPLADEVGAKLLRVLERI